MLLMLLFQLLATEVANVARGRFDRLRRSICGPLATTCAHWPLALLATKSHRRLVSRNAVIYTPNFGFGIAVSVRERE